MILFSSRTILLFQLCDLALLEELRMPQIYYDLIIGMSNADVFS